MPSWTNWDVKSGEPNDYPPTGEDYVVMFTRLPSPDLDYAIGMWNDYSGLDSFSVICVGDPIQEPPNITSSISPTTDTIDTYVLDPAD